MPPSNVSPFPERNGKLFIMLLLVPSVGPPLSVEVYKKSKKKKSSIMKI